MRTSSKDEAARIRPARIMSLEGMLEYVQQDELVEICPNSLRLRKRLLKEGQRRRCARLAPTRSCDSGATRQGMCPRRAFRLPGGTAKLV